LSGWFRGDHYKRSAACFSVPALPIFSVFWREGLARGGNGGLRADEGHRDRDWEGTIHAQLDRRAWTWIFQGALRVVSRSAAIRGENGAWGAFFLQGLLSSVAGGAWKTGPGPCSLDCGEGLGGLAYFPRRHALGGGCPRGEPLRLYALDSALLRFVTSRALRAASGRLKGRTARFELLRGF